jgi:cell division protein FtsB
MSAMIRRLPIHKLSFCLWIGALTLAILYFAFHLIGSDKGLFALMRAKQRHAMMVEETEKLHAEKTKLVGRISLLHSKSIDVDLLDEQARKLLGKAPADERVIYLEE